MQCFSIYVQPFMLGWHAQAALKTIIVQSVSKTKYLAREV